MRPSPSSITDPDLVIKGGGGGGGIKLTICPPPPPPPPPSSSNNLPTLRASVGSKNKGKGAWPPGPLPWIRLLLLLVDLLSPDWAVGVVLLCCACLLSGSSLFLFPLKMRKQFGLFKCTDRWILHDYCLWVYPLLLRLSGKKNDIMYVNIGYI